jgi:hypothetical protein
VNTNVLGDDFGYGDVGSGIGVWKDVALSGTPLNYATDRATFDRILLGDMGVGFFFVTSGGLDVEVRNCTFNTLIQNCFTFADGGNKTFINCVNLDINGMSGFFSSGFYNEEYTVDRIFLAEDGSPLEGINNKAWNRVQNPNSSPPLFDVDSVADGTIAQQQVRVFRRPTQGLSGRIDYNPITFIARRAGWARERFDWALVAFVEWATRMLNVELE